MQLNLVLSIAIGTSIILSSATQAQANEISTSLTTIERNGSITIEPEESKIDWLKVSTECYQSERERNRAGIVATQFLNLAERDYCRYLSTFASGELPNP